MRKILVTSALVYANGPMHLGHILEQIQVDIWVRFQKLRGNQCLYICGDDAHGTPIMIAAQREKISPEELVSKVKVFHEEDALGFLINFDNYYTTHSQENLELTNLFYHRLKDNGDIEVRAINQVYDEDAGMFLPDRYVKGTCPKCGAPDQYGDNCEHCGATYSASELLEPLSIISGKPPVQRRTEHYFFKLHKYEGFLREWVRFNLPIEISNKLDEWFSQGLKDWDISRDSPYFGFEIPDVSGKYFYVWLDAPIGYLASLKNLSLIKNTIIFNDYFSNNSIAELYHFVGKDIVYFHALFWPAILEAVGYRKPTSIFIHGYLTINGQKMSKSRGTFVLARDYLNHLNPEYLRYYLASKLNNSIDDIDLNFDDFIKKNNSDLVGKVVNIASRLAGFVNRGFNGVLADRLDAPLLFENAVAKVPKIAEAFETRNYASAIRLIMEIANTTNQYIDEHKPWMLAKEHLTDPKIQLIVTMGLNMYKLLIILLKPIVPSLAEQSEIFLATGSLQWKDCSSPLLNHKIGEFENLISRVDPGKVAAVLGE